MSVATGKNPLRILHVTARDQAIYQAICVDGKPQRTVALEYKLSQPRVNAIIKRVNRWLSQGDPPGLGELPRRERLRVVSRLHRMRLDRMYAEAMDAWHKSDTTTHKIKEKIVKGEIVSRETQVQTRIRDQRYLQNLCGIVDRIVGFEGFGKLGNVDESCEGRVYELPEQTPVEACREVKRRMILGGFDTAGDEGIPGLWEEEMQRRNAEVGKGRSEKAEGRSEKAEGRSEVGESIAGADEAKPWEGEAPAEPKAERQRGEHSLAPVLRGEGRGEGPAPREEPASSTEISHRDPGIPPIQLLSKNQPVSAQVDQQQSLAKCQCREKVLSNNPPKKSLRVLMMGTAAEMAENVSFDEYFSPEARLAHKLAGGTASSQHGLQTELARIMASRHRE